MAGTKDDDGVFETEDAPVSLKLERQEKAIEVLSRKDESFWGDVIAYRGEPED